MADDWTFPKGELMAGKRGLIINGTEFVSGADDLTVDRGAETPSHAVH